MAIFPKKFLHAYKHIYVTHHYSKFPTFLFLYKRKLSKNNGPSNKKVRIANTDVSTAARSRYLLINCNSFVYF